MLSIVYGKPEDAIYNPKAYFDIHYDEEWFDDEFVRQMVKDVDKSEVVSRYCINSPVLGQIPPQMLSGGVKTLILIYKIPDRLFNASACGENCYEWLLKIGDICDRTINFRHPAIFERESFQVRVVNDDVICHNMKELIDYAIKRLNEVGL